MVRTHAECVRSSGHRRQHDCRIDAGCDKDVGVRRRVSSTVDVAAPVDGDGSEEARNRTRGRNCLARCRDDLLAPEHCPPRIAASHCCYPQISFGPRREQSAEMSEMPRHVDPTVRQHRQTDSQHLRRRRTAQITPQWPRWNEETWHGRCLGRGAVSRVYLSRHRNIEAPLPVLSRKNCDRLTAACNALLAGDDQNRVPLRALTNGVARRRFRCRLCGNDRHR